MKLENCRMIVLGSKGMLGQMVCQYFRDRVKELVASSIRFNLGDCGRSVGEISRLEPDIVVNGIGKIKQKTQNPGELHFTNAVFPLELRTLLPSETVLIHPSTDCVFSGSARNPYLLTDLPDAGDVYGWSKFLGEQALMSRPLTLIPRVSIIGPDERQNGPGLLNWFLQQADGSRVNGFTNHLWNGITTLRWCQEIERELEDGRAFREDQASLVQWGTKESISKFELLKQIAEVMGRDLDVREFEAPESIYRVLHSSAISPPIREQLEELRSFEEAR